MPSAIFGYRLGGGSTPSVVHSSRATRSARDSGDETMRLMGFLMNPPVIALWGTPLYR